MRKNTAQALDAFVKARSFHGARDHIVVAQDGYVVCWLLHGSVIAQWKGQTLTLSTCHWNTPTTWDRLNAITRHYGISFKSEQSMKRFPGFLQEYTLPINRHA